ncbi:universal stress protein [Halodesulfovibrio marinisediminis]|uniref:Nucleotide-binding universal stress protein, UspA family n=1 Tax=Halodesulfovibrio marinisediminis DSM 17456 TaxID=1121457 RepID=A0A1N6I7E1_9BACT|nr:universal stress protein [Halodesulfovibrio marinisediminis]SIO27920.1 Nucleotide-binding universal stress protein, UspA family [Halodesulfovibrio marinisediminis DSM 17456]
MYEKMLVAFDGAETSLPLVRQAAHFARLENCSVHIVTACPKCNGELRIQGTTNVLNDMYEKISKSLDDIVGECKADGIEVYGHFCVGNPAEIVLEKIGDLGIDIVALGTHSTQLLQSVVIGSVAEAVVRKTTCDLLILTGANELSFESIFLAYDGSREADAAARQACTLAECYGSRLTAGIAYEMEMEAFSVYPAVETTVVDKTEQIVESIKSIVESTAVRDFDVVIRYGNPVHKALVEEAQKKEAGLIVVGTRAYSKLFHLLVGGVVYKLVYSSCPVLIVKNHSKPE